MIGRLPWIVNGHLLAFHMVPHGVSTREVVFKSLIIWVRLYDVPYSWIMEKKSKAVLGMVAS